jgi:hypothetical protein
MPSRSTPNTALPTRYTVIFSADTGGLIADEQVLTTTAGKLKRCDSGGHQLHAPPRCDWQPVPTK